MILLFAVFVLFLLCVCAYRKLSAYQTPEEKDEREKKKKKGLQWNSDSKVGLCLTANGLVDK